jgi:hypothetical protein
VAIRAKIKSVGQECPTHTVSDTTLVPIRFHEPHSSITGWLTVAEARHKPNWWGILTIVPIVNIVVPGYLAWSD